MLTRKQWKGLLWESLTTFRMPRPVRTRIKATKRPRYRHPPLLVVVKLSLAETQVGWIFLCYTVKKSVIVPVVKMPVVSPTDKPQWTIAIERPGQQGFSGLSSWRVFCPHPSPSLPSFLLRQGVKNIFRLRSSTALWEDCGLLGGNLQTHRGYQHNWGEPERAPH